MPADLQSAPVVHLGTRPLTPLPRHPAQDSAQADGRTRTDNLLITNELLYRLSYVGNRSDENPNDKYTQLGIIVKFTLAVEMGFWELGRHHCARQCT
jgi:hypothetical protein